MLPRRLVLISREASVFALWRAIIQKSYMTTSVINEQVGEHTERWR